MLLSSLVGNGEFHDDEKDDSFIFLTRKNGETIKMLIYVVSYKNFNLSCHDPFHILSFSVESFLLYRNNPRRLLFSNRSMWTHFNRVAFSLESLRMGSHVFGIWGIRKFK